ncbi:MAG TPA: hypothetical protein VEZ72_03870 [Paenibacillus sp.]|nr:hypothetical protein [Paenibacillus sp.]
MNRYVAGWAFGMLLLVACIVALAGWAPAKPEARGAAAAADVARLAALADGVVAGDGRLWVVTARTPDGMLRWSGDDAAEAARWIEETATSAGDSTLWFVNVQGKLSADATIADVGPRIEAVADASLIEAYEDGGTTFSYAYDAPAFETTVGEGDGAISLQTAAHLDTESGEWRVTLGTPVVMMEY